MLATCFLFSQKTNIVQYMTYSDDLLNIDFLSRVFSIKLRIFNIFVGIFLLFTLLNN